MNDEIERKFIVKSDIIFDNSIEGVMLIYQRYLMTGEQELRLRHNYSFDEHTHTHYLTFKCGQEPCRKEFETKISTKRHFELCEQINGIPLEKTRYIIVYNNILIEVDKYDSNFHNYLIAEVEFPTIEEAKAFEMPKQWLIKEVTGNPDFKNANIWKYINGKD